MSQVIKWSIEFAIRQKNMRCTPAGGGEISSGTPLGISRAEGEIFIEIEAILTASLAAKTAECKRLRDLVEMAYMEGWVDRVQPGYKGLSWEACFAKSNPSGYLEAFAKGDSNARISQ